MANNFWTNKDREKRETLPYSSRQDASKHVHLELESSIWKFDLRSGQMTWPEKLLYAFESSWIARFIIDVEKQLKRSTTVSNWTFASNGTWHDLENKVTARQRKVMELATCRICVKRLESKLCKKPDVYRKKCSVQPRKTVWWLASTLQVRTRVKHWKQDEKESGSVEIKLKRHLAIEFRLINGIGDNFRLTAIVLWLRQQTQRLQYWAHSKETAITSAGFIRIYR